jgi:hypothetical protein
MKVFEANIPNPVIGFFGEFDNLSVEFINTELKSICGINSFFTNQSEFNELSIAIRTNKHLLCEPDRAEYGDFQTNINLSDNVCEFLKNQNTTPEVIIEPTCGKGNFIISSLNTFESVNLFMELKFTNLMYGKRNLPF